MELNDIKKWLTDNKYAYTESEEDGMPVINTGRPVMPDGKLDSDVPFIGIVFSKPIVASDTVFAKAFPMIQKDGHIVMLEASQKTPKAKPLFSFATNGMSVSAQYFDPSVEHAPGAMIQLAVWENTEGQLAEIMELACELIVDAYKGAPHGKK